MSRRTRSLARASGRPIAESSVQESHGVYRGNFSFQQTLRVDSSVGNQTQEAGKAEPLNLKASEKRKVRRHFRPRAASLFDFDQMESATNPELSVMQDTASSNMYITE